MTDYIGQAYRYLTNDDLLEPTILTTIKSLVEGIITLMYVIISVFTVVFLDRLMKETE